MRPHAMLCVIGLGLALFAAWGCGPSATSGGADASDGTAGRADASAADPYADSGPGGADAARPPGTLAVYAHSNRQLYRIDPDTLSVELVDNFHFSDGINQMTDLAIDRDGQMIGVSFREVYRVDPETADATLLAELDQPFNGLSYVARGAGEILVGTAQSGDLYEIDSTTGVATPTGAYGDGLESSGDLVSVTGLGTFATVMRDGWSSDRLAWIDPLTGIATEVGDTGVARLWGLGFWNDRLFGFAEGGQFVAIDVTTGEAEVVSETGVTWWGAAVTTSAPVIL